MCQVLQEGAKDCESTKSLPLQAEQDDYLLDLSSYASSLSTPKLTLSG